VITGRNDVDAASLTTTAKADDGSAKPQLAIDSSALGGMYAGAIRLVGTEAGVGVKLAGDMAASAGDIQIDANGQLSMARTAASRDLQLKAENIELNADTFAGRNALVDASAQTRVKESLAATQQLTVKGGELLNQGVVEAGVRADGRLNNTATLSLQTNTVTNPGTITSHGNLKTDVQTLDNRAGKLLSAGDATLKAQTLENQGGRIVAQKDLDLSGNQLNNQGGAVLAKQAIKVTAANLANQNGTLAGGALDLQLSANLNNQNGLIESASDLQLAANSLSNNGGKLRALGGEGESRFVLGGLFNNDAGLVEIGSGAFALSSVGLSNLGGTVRHTGNQGIAIDLTALGQAGGRFITNGAVDLSLDEWSNISSLQAKTLNININRLSQSATGALLAVDGITTSGERWESHGRIETDGALHLTLSDAYTGNGKLLAQGDLSLTAKRADLGSAAELRSADSARIDISAGLSNAGKITSANDLNIKAASLNNQGTLGSAAALHIEAAQLINQGGLLFSGANMSLLGQRIENRRGDIYSLGNLLIAADRQGTKSERLSNLSGTVEATGTLDLFSQQIENARETFAITSRKYSARLVHVGCTDCSGTNEDALFQLDEYDRTEVLSNSAPAQLLAGGNMRLFSLNLDNRYSLIAAGGDLHIDTERLTNQGAQTGEVFNSRVLKSHRVRASRVGNQIADANSFSSRNWHGSSSYNPSNLEAELNSFFNWHIEAVRSTSAPVLSNIEYHHATIQAAGNLRIEAPERSNNSLIRPSFSYVAGGTRGVDTSVPGSSVATVVTLNPQLPPDLAQQAVDPLALPGFSLPQGQNGLFQINTQVGHRYLIETNPVFASLKNFLNSDYMLGNLGYDPQTAQKRLGDGLYEQRLIREAVVARTGQRYLAGLNSDEAQFRYLMDNAIASKQALKLSLGVSLTAEQVAALTHDLVWMEEREVAGQKVLVPVLYLAQAEGRLAPSGALIQGRDVTLISGGNLTNQGTLRASNNLSVTANTISNSGLMQASERLSLLATDSIRNAQGGIIAGKDVTAIALTGDIVNERSVTRHESGRRGYQHQQDFVDSAARIEASGDLTLAAGRDIQNIGSALKAGGDMQLNAGRDLVIASAQEHDLTTRKDRKGNSRSEQITQYGSEVEAGGNIALSAKRDLAVIASRVSAEEDLTATAGGDVMIAAAANEDHFESHRKSGGKKVDIVDSQVRQQAAELSAGGNLKVLAGNDLTAVASTLKAGDEAYLYAGNQLSLLAAQNSDYSLYDKQKKGGWGSKETQRDETTTIRNIGTSIESGGDLTLVSKGDQLYQKARLESGADLTLDSGGSITFEAVKDLDQESHEKSKGDAFWTSAKGKGQTDETLRQSVLLAQGEVVIKAVDGLKIDIKQIDQKAVSQTIDAMVQAEPELAWLKQAEARGDVDWRQVKEIHDSFKYEHSGLGPASQLIIAIAMAVIVGPAAAGAVGGGVGGAMAGAVATSAATNATVSTINNRGNLGAVFKDVTSSDAIKGYAVAAATAGIADKYGYSPTKLGFDTSSVKSVGIKITSDALIKTAAYGGSLKDNLGTAALGAGIGIAGAVGANEIGNVEYLDGSLQKIALHAALGGLMAEAMGGEFRAGALAAGANEALVAFLGDKLLPKGVDKNSPEYQQGMQNLLAASQIVGVLAAVAVDGDVNAGAAVAANATQNNFLNHQNVQDMVRELEGCESQGTCQQIRDKYRKVSDANRERLAQCKANGNCADIQKEIAAGKVALGQLKGFAGAIAEKDFNTRQWQDGNSVESILQQQAEDKVQALTERSQRERAEAMVEIGRSPEKHQQALDEMAKAAFQADLEKTLRESAELQQLAQKSAADLDALMPGWREYQEQKLGGVNAVKQGGVIVSEALSPDVWDALGPAAKVAKLAGIFAVMQKVPGKVSAELIDTATKLDKLLAGKAPSASDLAPFNKAAETKLAEEIKLANQTLASKPGASGSSVGPKATGEAVTQIPGRVQSRINIANGRTETTPLRDTGKPVSAGFDHVLEGHFNVAVANTRSVFTITPNELKGILQSGSVVKSPVTALPGGQFVRTVDTGRIIGTTTLKDGGLPTSVIKIFTDKAGNLISTFPVKAVN
jgi:filamentous hemagglutinin